MDAYDAESLACEDADEAEVCLASLVLLVLSGVVALWCRRLALSNVTTAPGAAPG